MTNFQVFIKPSISQSSELKIPGNTGYDGKQRYLVGFYLLSTLLRVAFLIEVNKVGVEPAVQIVNAEDPAALKLLLAVGFRRIRSTHIGPMVRR